MKKERIIFFENFILNIYQHLWFFKELDVWAPITTILKFKMMTTSKLTKDWFCQEANLEFWGFKSNTNWFSIRQIDCDTNLNFNLIYFEFLFKLFIFQLYWHTDYHNILGFALIYFEFRYKFIHFFNLYRQIT